jgi:hypothetical protein
MWDNQTRASRRNVYETLFAMREEIRDIIPELTFEQHKMLMCLNHTIPAMVAVGIYTND